MQQEDIKTTAAFKIKCQTNIDMDSSESLCNGSTNNDRLL